LTMVEIASVAVLEIVLCFLVSRNALWYNNAYE
jgi:hypothetical protein